MEKETVLIEQMDINERSETESSDHVITAGRGENQLNIGDAYHNSATKRLTVINCINPGHKSKCVLCSRCKGFAKTQ
jgi:hypothetical protein